MMEFRLCAIALPLPILDLTGSKNKSSSCVHLDFWYCGYNAAAAAAADQVERFDSELELQLILCNMDSLIIVAHGGAGSIEDSRVQPKLDGLKNAVLEGYKAHCKHKGCLVAAMKAAVATVSVMEDHWAFNAGFGSVLNEDGRVEMDAAVMDGQDLSYGGVLSVGNLKNVIQVAEKVATESNHCLFAAEGALRFAMDYGFQRIPDEDLISPQALDSFNKFKLGHKPMSNEIGEDGSRSTVGAVVMNNKKLVAATSTGGLMGKKAGRVGDSGIIGAGVYADNRKGAVSCTGIGESLLRGTVAYQIAAAIGSTDTTSVVYNCLRSMGEQIGGDGGAIAISPSGDIGIDFTSKRMAWAYISIPETDYMETQDKIKVHYGCNRGEHFEDWLCL